MLAFVCRSSERGAREARTQGRKNSHGEGKRMRSTLASSEEGERRSKGRITMELGELPEQRAGAG